MPKSGWKSSLAGLPSQTRLPGTTIGSPGAARAAATQSPETDGSHASTSPEPRVEPTPAAGRGAAGIACATAGVRVAAAAIAVAAVAIRSLVATVETVDISPPMQVLCSCYE